MAKVSSGKNTRQSQSRSLCGNVGSNSRFGIWEERNENVFSAFVEELSWTSKVRVSEVGKRSTFTSGRLEWLSWSRWHQLTNHSWLNVGAPGRKITLVRFQRSLLWNLWEWITQTWTPPPPQIAFVVLCLFDIFLMWFAAKNRNGQLLYSLEKDQTV